ncbi:MAG: C_GCAxxG_C_C family protein [Desulfobacterales bacterium]|nr:C_GCAxxG_C_C family protein [Desulfobacterales bacterium]
MNKCEFALERFKEGFRCSQAILEAYAKDYDLDPMVARKIATPVAGGSTVGGECGAVSGAFLVLGLKYGITDPTDMDGFWKLFGKVEEFAGKFEAIHGNINCRQLIGVDVFSEDGYKKFEEKNLHVTHCTKYVEDAVIILEEMIN